MPRRNLDHFRERPFGSESPLIGHNAKPAFGIQASQRFADGGAAHAKLGRQILLTQMRARRISSIRKAAA